MTNKGQGTKGEAISHMNFSELLNNIVKIPDMMGLGFYFPITSPGTKLKKKSKLVLSQNMK